MTREQLLELVAKLEAERLELTKRAQDAEKREKVWYELWHEKEAGTNDM